jgi:hypothetical protein
LGEGVAISEMAASFVLASEASSFGVLFELIVFRAIAVASCTPSILVLASSPPDDDIRL